MLETRLDNVVYRLGIAHTRRLARQMVSHGHFVVNGKRTTVPSYTVHAGDVITAREGSKKSVLFGNIEKKLQNYSVPKWLKFDGKTITATVDGMPPSSREAPSTLTPCSSTTAANRLIFTCVQSIII